MAMQNRARAHGRLSDQLRPLHVTFDVFPNASGSLLFSCGNTKILCAVTLQAGVPQFVRGTGSGWLNAEYALLPASTSPRSQRDSATTRTNKRAIEISRLISRALRTVCDLSTLGERTITVDCDVLQADGGTRVASITAASIALHLAQERWLQSNEIAQPFLQDSVAAIAVGVQDDQILLDPDYEEDSIMQADFNVVMTKSGKLIEIQGGAEKSPIAWELFDDVRYAACEGIKQLFTFFDGQTQSNAKPTVSSEQRAPFFSLKNRLQQQL